MYNSKESAARSTNSASDSASMVADDRRGWQPDGWQQFPIKQSPEYPNPAKLQQAVASLGKRPPLVFAGEIQKLQSHLAQAQSGKAFVLQGGDCAESFAEFSADNLINMLKVFLQMSVVLTCGAAVPVIKIGRIAGQFAKPRSEANETKNNVTLPSYRGDIINDLEFTTEARQPDPSRMLAAYNQSAASLNLLRALTNGGYADLHKVHNWNLDFLRTSPRKEEFATIARQIDDALAFMHACGVAKSHPNLQQVEFFTSHELLLLPYEQALTRRDSLSGKWYDCSAHFLWIGDRTKQSDHAHIAFASGIANPIGIKVGPTTDIGDLISSIKKVNPENLPGKVTLIVRYGAANIHQYFPKLIKQINAAGLKVTWFSDPMHGNTIKSSNGYKTRPFEQISAELSSFFSIALELQIIAGGIHFEMTGNDVTECIGGARKLSSDALEDRYHTVCDPRLNAEQSLELVFIIYSYLRQRQPSEIVT